MEEKTIRDISTGTATSTAQDFLETIPRDVTQALAPRFVQNLEKELQDELQSLIQSRLLWFQQAVQLELAEQQRLKKAEAARPEPTQAEPSPQLLEPASQPIAKRHSPRKVIEPQKVTDSSPMSDAAVTEEPVIVPVPAVEAEHSQNGAKPTAHLQDSQLTLPGLSEQEPLKPRRRRNAPEPSQEDILRQFSLNLEDFHSCNSDATPRRRRRRATALTS